jgi:WD40 repeat protein
MLSGHDAAVTCVAAHGELDTVVSGSQDGTIIIYSLRTGTYARTIRLSSSSSSSSSSSGSGGGGNNVGTAAGSSEGDDGSVNSNSRSTTTNLTRNSGDSGGSGNNHSSRATPLVLTWVGISNQGYIVAYVADNHTLYSFTSNGTRMARYSSEHDLYAFCLSDDGSSLITGGADCIVSIRWLHSLKLADSGGRKGMQCRVDGRILFQKETGFKSAVRSLLLTRDERHLIVGTESGEIRVLVHYADYLRARLQEKLKSLGLGF